jgi:hypothetical protein
MNPHPYIIKPDERGHRPKLPAGLKMQLRSINMLPTHWEYLDFLAESQHTTTAEILRKIVSHLLKKEAMRLK